MSSPTLEQDRAVRLFTYLKEFSMLKTPLVRNVENYEDVLWFADFPKEKECKTPLQEGDFQETWLYFEKPIKPELDNPHKKLMSWINRGTALENEDKEPKLLERIPNPLNVEIEVSSNEENKEPMFLYLSDFPEISKMFQEYLKDKWHPWKKELQRFKELQKVYTKLFSIYQKQKMLGEQFELIIGLGLLNWRTSNKQNVHRHILVVPASLNFDADSGLITVIPSTEGVKPELEQDMLELEERLDNTSLVPIREMVSTLQEEFWNRDVQDSVLRSYVQTLSAEGIYYQDEVTNVKGATTEPAVVYSPALILRKRVEKGFQQACTNIIENIAQDTESIPIGIKRIYSEIDDYQSEMKLSDNKKIDPVDNIVYFPKEANEEQQKIVERLNTRDGVLVQGPPGTGKSHTIANLTSHLLATGKRVLITSQTDRALKVLREKLPEELQQLCVSLLGSDAKSFKDLEFVINSISNMRDSWDESSIQNDIVQLTDLLRKLEAEKAELQQKLLSVREKETFEHYLLGGHYQGTAQKVAERINDERQQFGWIPDQIKIDDEIQLTAKEMVGLIRLFEIIKPEIEEELQLQFPQYELLRSPQEFNSIIEKESYLEQKIVTSITNEENHSIRKHPINRRKEFLDTIKKIIESINILESNKDKWVQVALKDLFDHKYQPWKEFYSQTQFLLEPVLELAKKHNLVEITGNSEPLNKVKADCSLLREHLESGKGLGLPVLRPKVVKESWYIIKDIRIDGQKCDNLQNVQLLEEVLLIEQTIHSLITLIKDQLNIDIAPKTGRALTIATIQNELDHFNTLNRLQVLLQRLPRELVVDVSKSNLLNLQKKIEIVGVKEELTEVKASLSKMVERVEIGTTNRHPVVELLKQAIINRNKEDYKSYYYQLQSLNKNLLKAQLFAQLKVKLQNKLPKLLMNLQQSNDHSLWLNRMNHFEEAVSWAMVDNWLNEFTNFDLEQLSKDLEQVESKIKDTITELGGKKAWSYTIKNMTEGQRQHLIAWATSMRKAGKMTGKHAPKHLKDAQYHMNYCRDAIPAWVLPLYRIFDTFEMKPNLFDVVIIDEASQSGSEAVILKYLAKKIIVVGDDKQISPESVGLDRDNVNRLRREYLFDFKIGNMLDGDTSFFDLANVLFGGRITLREHFRCMPEIIEFSNKISYTNTPLIPLRQYPPNRLEPIKTVHVRNGYREGTGQKVLNRPEAEEIVNTIKSCINDPKYVGKSIGVISLQGNGQAQEIQRLLTNEIGSEEMENRNLICGDAYAFQGDERDIIFISLVAAPGDTGMRALTSEKDRRRFNVAASRAKDQLWLFHTPTVNDFRNEECLRFQLIAYCQDPVKETMDSNREKCENNFEKAVFDQIVAKGFKVTPQHEVAGYRIDLVVEGSTGRIAVECDGDEWHGPDRYEYDMTRQRILERCGWTFWRVRGSEFYRNTATALDGLWQTLELYGITPVNNAKLLEKEIQLKDDENKIEIGEISEHQHEETTVLKEIHVTPIRKLVTSEQMKLDIGVAAEGQPSLFEEENEKTPIKIKTERNNTAPNSKNKSTKTPTLEEYLKEQGFEVFDKRSKGGALWLVDEEGVKPILQKLRTKGIHFTYSAKGGRTTKNRPAWFTSYKG